MIAYYYTTCTTDLVLSTPIRDYVSKELYSDLDEFYLAEFIRYSGILRKHPTAEFYTTANSAYVLVDGKRVYESVIIEVDETPVEFPDDDEIFS